MSNKKANIVLVVAVKINGDKSEPFRVYSTTDTEFKKGTVLRIDKAPESANGDEQVRIGNFEAGIIGTHGADYIDDLLKGFRRKVGDDLFLVCEKFRENIASNKELKEAEEV
jgi:hypothetical protein